MAVLGAKSGSQSSIKLSLHNRLFTEKESKKIVKSLLSGLSKGGFEMNSLIPITVSRKTEEKSKKTEEQEKAFSVLVTANPFTGETEFHAFDPVDNQNELGEGAQGKVIAAQNIITGDVVAVKIQRPNGMTFEEDVARERKNLLKAKRLIGNAQDKAKNEYTLMEYCKGINLLHDLYELDKSVDKESVAYFKSKKSIEIIKKFHLICLGLAEIIDLHKQSNLAHRDVKTDNFVFTERPYGSYLKLIDLGTAIDPNTSESNEIPLLKEFMGTFGYISPEVHHRAPYSYASDIWALGIVFAEILTHENYQAKLKQMNLANALRGELTHPTSQQIMEMMSDVFHPIDLAGKTYQQWFEENVKMIEKTESANDIERNLTTYSLMLINWMSKENSEQRPTTDQLENVYKILNRYFIDALFSLSLKQQHPTTHKIGRRNSVYPAKAQISVMPTISQLSSVEVEPESVIKNTTENKLDVVEVTPKLSSEEETIKTELCTLLEMLSISESSVERTVLPSANDRIMLSLFALQVGKVSEAIHTSEFDKRMKSLNKIVQRHIVSEKSTIAPQVQALRETCSKLTPK